MRNLTWWQQCASELSVLSVKDFNSIWGFLYRSKESKQLVEMISEHLINKRS